MGIMLKKMKQIALTAGCVAIFMAVETHGVAAHHGWSEYNDSQTLNVSGTIQQISDNNPHVVIQLQTKEKVWQAVLAPPSRMESRGLPTDQLQVGETVSLVGYPHRNEPNEMRAEQITVGEKTVPLR